MIDVRYTHRETGISFEYEEGQDSVVVKAPSRDGRVNTLTSAQLRDLAKLLLEIADKAALNAEVDYSDITARVDSASTTSYARSDRDEDIPF